MGELNSFPLFHKYDMKENIKRKSINEPVSDEAMERLAQIMTDSPTLVKLSKTEFAIKSLKPAVMWMIAEEAVKISKAEKASYSDVLKGLASNLPSVCRIITLAILNKKEDIEDEVTYKKVYETLFWECDEKEWGQLLFEILNLINVDVFFYIINSTQIFKEMALQRKTRMNEQK